MKEQFSISPNIKHGRKDSLLEREILNSILSKKVEL